MRQFISISALNSGDLSVKLPLYWKSEKLRFYITRKYWESTIKEYVRQMVGADLDFNVTDEVRKANEKFIVPDEVLV